MNYGIRLLMGLTLTWMIVVWPPLNQNLSYFDFPLGEVVALSEIETQTEKTGGAHSPDPQKKEEAQRPTQKPQPLEQGKECDPKHAPWWMGLHLPF
ncbi:MAG: hypothetical protein ACRCYZ_06545 [Alphaproteobacteria bacterium]